MSWTYWRVRDADFDSDTAMFTVNEIIVNKAKWCMDNWNVPVSTIGQEKVVYNYNFRDIARVDYLCSTQLIGEVCNLAQEFNSLYNNAINSQCNDDKYLNLIKDNIVKLAVLSRCAIDNSKRIFEINIKREMDKISRLDVFNYGKNKGGYKKKELPLFFKHIKQKPSRKNRETKEEFKERKKREERVYVKVDTPMDYVQDIISDKKIVLPAKRTKNIEIKEIIDLSNRRKCTKKQVAKVESLLTELSKIHTALKSSGEKEWFFVYDIFREDYVNKLSKIKISRHTMEKILFDTFGSKDESFRLGILSKTHQSVLLEIANIQEDKIKKVLRRKKEGDGYNVVIATLSGEYVEIPT